MDPDCPRVRLRAPSPSPPRRIRLRPGNEQEDATNDDILTPRRRDRRPPARRIHLTRPPVRTQASPTTVVANPEFSSPLPSTALQRSEFETSIDFDGYVSDIPSGGRDTEILRPLYTPTLEDPAPKESDDSYDHFVDAVLSQVCAMYQLTQTLFFVAGWNPLSNTSTSNWYHLTKMVVSQQRYFVCMCSMAKSTSNCFHTRFLQQYGEEQFPDRPEDLSDDNQTFLVSRLQEMHEGVYSNVFSVPKIRNPTIRNRAVVQYVGTDDAQGLWSCVQHPRVSTCNDIHRARESFQGLIQLDESAKDWSTLGAQDSQGHFVKRAAAKITNSISHLPRPVPSWAAISSDGPPPAITPIVVAPDIIPLEESPHCSFCKSKGLEPNPFVHSPILKQSCLIYGLVTAMRSQIERQKCPSCSRWIGPDCRDIGVFNWNSKILMTHQLLDDYTSCFTTSETPFTAWVNVISRRYPPDLPFVTERTFRDVWFSYVRLVKFEGSSKCPTCGPTPNAIIFDGVTLAFNRSNVLESLCPPTTIHADSIVRDKVVRRTNLQLIPERTLRKDVRSILTGPSLISGKTRPFSAAASRPIPNETLEDQSEESGSSMDEGRRERNNMRRQATLLKKKQALLDRVNLIPQVIANLSELSPHIGHLFQRIFGVPAINAGLEPPIVYQSFLIQITAEETSLQMMNNLALQSLLRFIQSPDRHTASALILIPALYDVLKYELSTYQQFQPDTLGVASWLYIRGETVRKTLLVHHTEPPNPALHNDKSWQETGCYYEMPQIRHRPRYPGLKEDSPAKKDSGSEAKGGCRKFFSTYSAKRLTGGIMVAWCSHSISYGFHCIPIGEGRNDVFSALYTRWEKAPPNVVYDFCCALQPYCSTREPEFFQDTLFVIDDFHASDHTKCCPSSFLRTYSRSDPRLLHLNSSAGECGNNGLGRIRKSIKYMAQDRAIIYCMVFLSIWNRQRIRSLAEKSSR